jgi:hypothetical protein
MRNGHDRYRVKKVHFFGAAAITIGFLGLGIITTAPSVGFVPPNTAGPLTSTPSDLTSVTCISSSFCDAVDEEGNLFNYNGTNWNTQNIDSGNELFAVSCSSTSFCAAGDSAGNVLTYNGTSWSSASNVDSTNELLSLSCVSSTFCVAGDNVGNVVSYNGSSWSVSNVAGSSALIYGISCTSSTFCMLVTSNGYAYSYNGTSWSSPAFVDSTDLDSVSCTSSSFCAAVDSVGDVAYYTGSTPWSGLTTIDSGSALEGISCTSSSFCAAVDTSGNALLYNGSSWSSTNPDGTNGMNGVSCASSTFCVAVDNVGNALYFTGSTPWTVTPIDPKNSITSLDCLPSPSTFCHLADKNGSFVYTTNFFVGRYGPYVVSSSDAWTGDSCTSSAFCVMVGGSYGGIWSGGSTVSTSSGIDSNGTIEAVSCQAVSSPTAQTLCWAVDSGGYAVPYKSSSGWGTPTRIDSATKHLLEDVSCVLASSSSINCMAVSNGGDIEIYNGSAWSSPSTNPVAGGALQSVSCTSTTVCVAVTGAKTVVWSGGWTAAPTLSSLASNLEAVSCYNTTTCEAINSDGKVWTTSNNFSSNTPIGKVDKYGAPQTISCSGTSTCAEGDTVGYVCYTSSNWSNAPNADCIKDD